LIVDASILLYAEDRPSPHHGRAVEWLTEALNGPVRTGLPWPSLLALTEHHLGSSAIPDAHLAALAVEHGVGVCSADTDFARFTGLPWFNPLSG
jgi:uncharacterized protein